MVLQFKCMTFVAIFALSGAINESLIMRAHIGLEKVLNFLLDDYQEVNLDCLFELVLANGFLENISRMKINQYELDIIDSYKKQIERIISLVKPILINDETSNRLFVERLINTTIWFREVTLRKNLINATYSVKNDIKNKHDFIEFESLLSFKTYPSDDCFIGVLTSGSYDVLHECSVNDWCINNMVNNNRIEPAYIVTHRLLLLQMAKAQNCKISEKEYNDFASSYCSYIYWEIRQNKKFDFISIFDDLLMEQVTLCGAEGFAEFAEEDLIEYVLGNQLEEGCFKTGKIEGNRRKRTANYIKHGCSDHATGLGASSISLFLLYLYQTP